MDLKLHKIQKEIIKKLTTKNGLRFSQIKIKFVDTEQLAYHLKILIERDLVKKDSKNKENIYTLTDLGKDYSSLTDDKIETVERQPKTSVIIEVKKEEDGEEYTLCCRRLRHPYFGKVGRIGGKVQFGETLENAVKRELFEETGLEAKGVKLKQIYRKLRRNEAGEIVQDVFFYIHEVIDYEGRIENKLEYQENFWLSKSEWLEWQNAKENLKTQATGGNIKNENLKDEAKNKDGNGVENNLRLTNGSVGSVLEILEKFDFYDDFNFENEYSSLKLVEDINEHDGF